MCCQTIWLGGSVGILIFFHNVFCKVAMPGPGESSYNSWGSAGGLPPLGSLTLNYSVTIPNSNDFPDESDSGTARTGNQVGARSAATQFRLGAQYSDAFNPEQFDDAPYVPPRSGQSLPNPYTVHTSHSPHAHTRTHGIPSVSILTRHLNISSLLIPAVPSTRVLPDLIRA